MTASKYDYDHTIDVGDFVRLQKRITHAQSLQPGQILEVIKRYSADAVYVKPLSGNILKPDGTPRDRNDIAIFKRDLKKI